MPWASVFDNVHLPLKLQGQGRRQVKDRVEDALSMVGLQDFHKAYPRELSGGMKMRVSIARALVTKPKLLLMDEPFAALDEITRIRLNNDLLQLWEGQGWTVVFVTHSVYEIGLPLVQDRRHGSAPRADRGRDRDRRALPARRGLPHVRALQRLLPRGVGRVALRHGGHLMSTMIEDDRVIGLQDEAIAEAAAQSDRRERVLRWAMPLGLILLVLGIWEIGVWWNETPHYILPGPILVIKTLFTDWHTLYPSLLVTLKITFSALAIAIIGGVGLAVLFTLSKWVELSLFPFAVIAQVTPIIAIAPLILIYVPSTYAALLLCAWIVAFFPILSNTTLGLNSADHNLVNLFQLYGANRWQMLRYLRLPSAMPYFLGGLKIAGGLALIGAIVAEFAAGTAGTGSGLAYRILEASYRLNIPRMFASLILISVSGILIFFAFSLLSHLMLRKWHESALKREN